MQTPPKFAIQHDMRPIYRELYKRYKGAFPEILVFDEFEDDHKILSFLLDRKDRRRILCVKDGEDEEIVKTICEEIDHPSCPPAYFPLLGHNCSDEFIGRWTICACCVADALDIPLKQMMFMYTDEMSGFSEILPTVINETQASIALFVSIAHEQRHGWQHVHHPEWIDEYIHPDDDVNGYFMQKAEIDAEAFGRRLASMVLGVHPSKLVCFTDEDLEYNRNLYRYMENLDLSYAYKKAKEIRKIVDLRR